MDLAEQSDLAEAVAIAGMMSPEDIAKGLSSRNKRTSRLSALALRQCGSRATKPLLDAYFASNGCVNGRTKKFNVTLAVLAALAMLAGILVIAALLPETGRHMFTAGATTFLTPIMIGRFMLSRESRPALRALCLVDDKRALEAVIDSLTRPGVRKPDVHSALARLLPQVTAEDRDVVSPLGLRTLSLELDYQNEPLCHGILHAIEILGEGTCATRLKHFVEELNARHASATGGELLVAAEKCLQLEAARISDQQTARSLLRAVEVRPDGSDLLRPARATGQEAIETLVRAAKPPQEERLDQRGL